jgi:hypothetical protein
MTGAWTSRSSAAGLVAACRAADGGATLGSAVTRAYAVGRSLAGNPPERRW